MVCLLPLCAFSAGASGFEAASPGAQRSDVDLLSLIPPIRGIPKDILPQGIPDKGSVSPAKLDGDLLRIIPIALSWLGTPYRTGGISKSGTDCSGFVHAVLQAALPELGPFPRTSWEFGKIGTEVDKSSIQPGDILLFENAGAVDHVGIALSPYSFIHSASEGSGTGVIISYLTEGSWDKILYDVRRLAQ